MPKKKENALRMTIAVGINSACVFAIWYLVKHGFAGDYDGLTGLLILGLLGLVAFFLYDGVAAYFDTTTRTMKQAGVGAADALEGFEFEIGTQRQIRRLFESKLAEPEKILCPALRLLDTTIYAVKAPGRHVHCRIRLMMDNRSSSEDQYTYGYLTNHGRFLDRSRAMALATLADQVRKDFVKKTPMHQLFCDDLRLETLRE